MNNRWAILGLGFIAPRHIEAIKHIGGELIASCDIDSSKQLDGVPFWEDWRAMLDSAAFEEVENVAICTPNYLHYSMIKECVKRRKRVLCEKPLVLSVAEAIDIPNNVFTVLQLRYHSEVKKLKELPKQKTAFLSVKVKRDDSYWAGWKGKEHQSGGILMNIGVHYFDILIYLWGDSYKILKSEKTQKRAIGVIDFTGCKVNYEVEILQDNNGQDRYLEVNGKKYQFSNQDNLSYEDLHKKVYEDFTKGLGVTPKEAVKSIRLVSQL